jgi:hypothetical protein
VTIDRRVQILDGPADATETTVSALRGRPFLVLLGEPGIGKTTVLEQEAAAAGTALVKVRDLINETVVPPPGTLFLDALDEYRVGATDFDKVHRLVNAIRVGGDRPWRLTCRAEDWQKDADLAAIGRTTAGAPITVAQLLPLNLVEALAVLATLGEPDPDAFVDRALAMGAAGLLESPLSLTLLRQSVIGDQPWPVTRFALFDQATFALAHEDNAIHRLDRDRSSADAILSAAARASLFLLLTGSRSLWRSGALPRSHDRRAYLPASALGLAPALVDDLVGSSLFRGEGEAFEPVHRTITEFLGGRALAQAIVATTTTAALPLGRAQALVTGVDGRAPTDLRGLYAWFAAHLAAFGEHALARELVEADAVSALVYGDAAMFDTAAKRAMLANLDRHDPYFRASEVGATSVGGLASEELSAELAQAIEHGDGSHRMMTVYEVLAAGPPVVSLLPLLRRLALDQERPEWQRTRAADAWLHGQADPMAARRELFDALAGETRSSAREALRAELLGTMPAEAVSLDDIIGVIADFSLLPDDNTIMRLFGLQRSLEAHPRPELFDTPLAWLPEGGGRQHGVEIEGVLDQALAAAIEKTSDLDATRLWKWLVHARDDKWTNLGDKTRPAVRAWLAADHGRSLALFEAILAGDDAAEGPWMIGTYYLYVAGDPAGPVLDRLITLAAEAAGAAERRLLEIAVNIARRFDVGAANYWRLHAFLEALPGGAPDLLRELTVAEVEPWRERQYSRTRKTDAAEAKRRAKQLVTLKRNLSGIAGALYKSTLAWAAEIYFHPRDKKDSELSGLERLEAETDGEVLGAVRAGWRLLATTDMPEVTPASLGEIEASGGYFYSEYGALAGLDRLHAEGDAHLMTLPLTLAVIVLRSGWITHPSGHRDGLERWAWARLNVNAARGAVALETYWNAIVAHGGHSNHWHQAAADDGGDAAAIACAAMLAKHPAASPDTLRSLIAAAAKRIDRPALGRLASTALADLALPARQRALWTFARFIVDPLTQQDPLSAQGSADLLELFDGISGTTLVDLFPAGSDAEQAAVAAGLFDLVAPHADPYVERRSGRVLQTHRLSDAGNVFLKRLGASPGRHAGDGLAALRRNVAAFPKWEPALRHAAEQQARARRDAEYLPPDAAALAAALDGRAPVNAADLRAIVVDELTRLGRELRTGATSPWRDYWNTDSSGKATTPKIENIARDITLTRLGDRLAKYRIAVALPEGQRRDDTRADVLIVSGAGRNLPIEAKRHYHADLWTAAAGQLQGYAADEGADGRGILLVFWYGDVEAPPSRAGGAVATSAAELEALLIGDLSPELRTTTDVIVLDVSAPERAKPKVKKATKPANAPKKATTSRARTASPRKAVPAARTKTSRGSKT